MFIFPITCAHCKADTRDVGGSLWDEDSWEGKCHNCDKYLYPQQRKKYLIDKIAEIKKIIESLEAPLKELQEKELEELE